MLHGIWDAIRNNADKILDNALGLLRDSFLVVFGIHYRNHILRRKAEAKELAAKHEALEEQVREFRNRLETEDGRKTQGADAAGQENGVDSKPDSGNRNRSRTHGKQGD